MPSPEYMRQCRLATSPLTSEPAERHHVLNVITPDHMFDDTLLSTRPSAAFRVPLGLLDCLQRSHPVSREGISLGRGQERRDWLTQSARIVFDNDFQNQNDRALAHANVHQPERSEETHAHEQERRSRIAT